MPRNVKVMHPKDFIKMIVTSIFNSEKAIPWLVLQEMA